MPVLKKKRWQGRVSTSVTSFKVIINPILYMNQHPLHRMEDTFSSLEFFKFNLTQAYLQWRLQTVIRNTSDLTYTKIYFNLAG